MLMSTLPSSLPFSSLPEPEACVYQEPNEAREMLLLAPHFFLLIKKNRTSNYQLPAAAKSLQSCPTLCDPMMAAHQAPVPGILQARTLEWVAISFSSA